MKFLREYTISTHAPAGGATGRRRSCTAWRSNFYSRPCGRGDTFSFRVWPVFQISTHAPAGGATFAPYLEEFYGDVFLLTPLREGRRDEQAGRRQPAAISTHAPAGGATETEMVEKSKIIVISTHAPAGGATAHAGAHFRARADFYSRPCGRGDTWTGKGFHRSAISTHAPAGGATRSALYAETGAYTISTHAPAGGATQNRART